MKPANDDKPIVSIMKPEYQQLHADMMKVFEDYCTRYQLSAVELLAISAQIVGQVMAMQDQRKMTPEKCSKMIGENITMGNKFIIDKMLGKPQGSA